MSFLTSFHSQEVPISSAENVFHYSHRKGKMGAHQLKQPAKNFVIAQQMKPMPSCKSSYVKNWFFHCKFDDLTKSQFCHILAFVNRRHLIDCSQLESELERVAP